MDGRTGLWRATYTPGAWVVLSGPTLMVIMPPAAPKHSRLLNDLWTDVVGARSVADLTDTLGAYRLSTLPDFCALFWGDGEMRSLVRGEIRIVDAESGEPLVTGEGVYTWSEIGLGGMRRFRVDMEPFEGERLALPLVVGAVTAGAVLVDCTDEARLVFPMAPEALAASSDADDDEPQPTRAVLGSTGGPVGRGGFGARAVVGAGAVIPGDGAQPPVGDESTAAEPLDDEQGDDEQDGAVPAAEASSEGLPGDGPAPDESPGDDVVAGVAIGTDEPAAGPEALDGGAEQEPSTDPGPDEPDATDRDVAAPETEPADSSADGHEPHADVEQHDAETPGPGPDENGAVAPEDASLEDAAEHPDDSGAIGQGAEVGDGQDAHGADGADQGVSASADSHDAPGPDAPGNDAAGDGSDDDGPAGDDPVEDAAADAEPSDEEGPVPDLDLPEGATETIPVADFSVDYEDVPLAPTAVFEVPDPEPERSDVAGLDIGAGESDTILGPPGFAVPPPGTVPGAAPVPPAGAAPTDRDAPAQPPLGVSGPMPRPAHRPGQPGGPAPAAAPANPPYGVPPAAAHPGAPGTAAPGQQPSPSPHGATQPGAGPVPYGVFPGQPQPPAAPQGQTPQGLPHQAAQGHAAPSHWQPGQPGRPAPQGQPGGPGHLPPGSPPAGGQPWGAPVPGQPAGWPPPPANPAPAGHSAPAQSPAGPPAGGAGLIANVPSFGTTPPPVSPPRPVSATDPEGETVFATGIAATHKVAPGSAPRSDLVLAALCNRQHPNPPDARVCSRCGAPVDPHSSQLVSLPVLALLRASHGESRELDGVVLIGRAPSPQPADVDPDLLTVPSPSQDISRTHLRVAAIEWEIVVTDLHSTNGTQLIRPGEPAQRMLPGEPVAVGIGTILDLGDGVTILVDQPK